MAKNYYILMHQGSSVHGVLVLGVEDPEAARMAAVDLFTKALQKVRTKYSGDPYGIIARTRNYRNVLLKPWRKHFQKWMSGESVDPHVEIVELPDSYAIVANYWLGFERIGGNYICNMPKIREEHPKGYVVSRMVHPDNVV